MKKKLMISTVLIVFSTLILINCSVKQTEPKLEYSTYLGSSGNDGSNNWLTDFSRDDSGTLFFASSTYHTDFPVTEGAYDNSYNGGDENWGMEDIAIVEFNIEKNKLEYASFFGGKTGPEFVSQVLRVKNSTYLVGNTGSNDFPVTTNAYDGTFNGPVFRHSDGYLSHFEDNKLTYSTYIGTSGFDWIQKVFVDDNGEIIVVGMMSEWEELPISKSFSTEKIEGLGNACVIRLSARGDKILSATLLGPSWYVNAARDKEGNIYVVGSTPSESFPTTEGAYDTSFNGGEDRSGGDIFITKLSAKADEIIFSTFLGGEGKESFPAFCLDALNNLIVFANTRSKDFPLSATALDKKFDGEVEFFLAKLSNDGKELLYSSYLGGTETNGENKSNIVCSPSGDIYVCGSTDSKDFPITENAIQSEIKGGADIFLSVFDGNFSKLKYSTFLGGSGVEEVRINVDAAGNIYGVGMTTSNDFPTTPGAYSETLKGEQDIVIFKMSPGGIN